MTAVVGVGVLGLPYSFSYLGWAGGITALIVTLAASLYTAHLLAVLHEDPDGTRHDRYVDLGVAILGTHPVRLLLSKCAQHLLSSTCLLSHKSHPYPQTHCDAYTACSIAVHHTGM